MDGRLFEPTLKVSHSNSALGGGREKGKAPPSKLINGRRGFLLRLLWVFFVPSLAKRLPTGLRERIKGNNNKL